MPNGRCRLHGGASPIGPAHPSFRTGKHSKYLPKNLAQGYSAALNDPNLLTLREEVALVDLRIGQLLVAVGQTGNTRLWRDATNKLQAFKQAAGKGKDALGVARGALEDLDGILQSGLTAAATWDELRETIELRRRLSDSETKRLKDLHQMISAGTAIALMRQLLLVVTDHVDDRAAKAAIAAEFIRLTSGGSGEDPVPS